MKVVPEVAKADVNPPARVVARVVEPAPSRHYRKNRLSKKEVSMNMFNLIPIPTQIEMVACTICEGCLGCDGGCQGCQVTATGKKPTEPIE